jgi:hypothetical protein
VSQITVIHILIGRYPLVDDDHFFGVFPARMQLAAKHGTKALRSELQHALAEALMDETMVRARMPRVICSLFGIFNDLLRPEAEGDAVGSLLVQSLFQLSLSLTLHEVSSHISNSSGAHCALVLGFGGSGIESLEEQTRFYQSHHFSTIATTCTGVPALELRQYESIANRLNLALSSGGRLVLHCCSNHGVSLSSVLMGLFRCILLGLFVE